MIRAEKLLALAGGVLGGAVVAAVVMPVAVAVERRRQASARAMDQPMFTKPDPDVRKPQLLWPDRAEQCIRDALRAARWEARS